MTEVQSTQGHSYTLRPATLDDVSQIHALHRAISLHHHGVEGMPRERLWKEYTSPGFQVQESVLLILDDQNRLAGAVEVWDNISPPIHPYIRLRIHPDADQAGLLPVLLEWAEQRAEQAVERVDPDLRVSLYAETDHSIPGQGQSCLAFGMELIRHSLMMRIELDKPPPTPGFPPGIMVRTVDPAQDARAVYQVDDEVFQDHFGYIAEDPGSGWERFLHHMTGEKSFDPSLWFVAGENREIVGICLCRSRGYDAADAGHISSLGVRRPWRRRGIGLGLLQHAFSEFYRRGYAKVDLEVDAMSLTGAVDLYRKAGMEVIRQFDLYEKQLRPGREVSVTGL